MTKELSTGAAEYLNTRLFSAMLGSFPKGQALAAASGISGIQSGIIEAAGDKSMLSREGVRYTLSYRHSCGRAAFSKVVSAILENSGCPVSLPLLEKEISVIFPADKTATAKLRTHLEDKTRFFRAGEYYGLTKWLLVPGDDEEDFAFANSVSDEEAAAWNGLPAGDAEKSPADILSGEPVSVRALQYLAWKREKDENCFLKVYEKLLASDAVFLRDGTVCSKKTAEGYRRELARFQKALGDSPADPLTPEDIYLEKSALKKITDTIIRKGCFELKDAAAKYYGGKDACDPQNLKLIKDYLFSAINDERIDHDDSQWFVKVDFDDEDRDDICSFITEKGSVTAEDIIAEFLGIPMEHAGVPALKKRLAALMAGSENILVSGERYSKAVMIPEWAKAIPDSLVYTEPEPVEDMEGDIYDCMLEPEGFDPALRSEIYNPLAEDYGDEDPSRTIYSIDEAKQRCVLKYHHRMAGTFPLCQVQPGFFEIPENADVFPVDISGKTVYINKNTRLIYGMADFYSDITSVSGTVFYIHKTPEGYTFENTGETEKNCAIDTNRSMELLELAEQDNLTVFDIICRILSRKPLSFPALYTEVNIVRRCSRLLVASILSSYHCFNVKGKTGLWAFDEKKIDQGFNKNKKKYIKK